MQTKLKLMASLAAASCFIVASVHADDSFPPCSRGATGTTFQSWSFNVSNNPTAAESFSNPYGVPQATMTLGSFATGWRSSTLGRTGVWDLGRGGSSTLSLPSFPGNASSWQYVQVQVTYYDDGTLYVKPAISIPGGALISSASTNNQSAPPGNWKTTNTVWLVQPSSAITSISLVGNATKGLILDQVIVDAQASSAADGDVVAFRPCWRGLPSSTFQHWMFGVSNNPSSVGAELVTNAYGTPQATISPGPFSDGWIYQDSFLGCREGVWDLAENGSAVFTIPNSPAPPANSYKLLSFQLTQYRDGLYDQDASVTIPGASLVEQQEQVIDTTSFGGTWVVQRSLWRLGPPVPGSESITVSSAPNGTLIDQAVVDTYIITSTNVYVDDDYASLPDCTAVGWPAGALPTDKIIGQSAFATLPGGIAAAPIGGTVQVAAGTYAGPVTLANNLTLALGPNATNATINGNLALTAGSTLSFDINGTNPGVQYDRWRVNGTVNLGSANLSINDTVTFPIGTTFVLIDNDGFDPVTGTFAGLPQGAVINGNFQQFRVSYTGGSGNDVALIVTNRNPVAVTDYAATTPNVPVTIPFVKLLLNDFDPDGDTFGFLNAFAPFATNGNVSVNFSGNTVTYTPPLNFSGSNWFAYTIQDSHGGIGTGRVDVLVRPDTQTFNIISIVTTNSGATFTVTLTGVPNYTYSLQRSSGVTGPWSTIASIAIPASGITTYYDTNPPAGTGFYRTAYP